MTATLIAGALLLCAACSGSKTPEPTPPDEAAAQEAAPTGAVAADETPEAPAIPAGERGGICGGIGGVQCVNDDDYCALESGVCATTADAAGVCKERPQVCTQDYTPVCGCDGETYSNACVAASKGVSVAYGGECTAAQE
ncbi:MAG: Kazal domain-containing protein [Alphaproteobacteria bacterium]|nr:Kazal domain-containing protein [Alphaproteobacteria bacterium]